MDIYKFHMQNLHDLHVWQESHIYFTTKSWRQIYMRLYQEHSIDNTNIFISESICDYPHLELTEKSWFVSR